MGRDAAAIALAWVNPGPVPARGIPALPAVAPGKPAGPNRGVAVTRLRALPRECRPVPGEESGAVGGRPVSEATEEEGAL